MTDTPPERVKSSEQHREKPARNRSENRPSYAALKQKIRRLEAKLTEYQKKTGTLTKKLNKQNNVQRQLRHEIKALKEDQSRVREEKNRLRQENARLTRKLHDVRKENTKAKELSAKLEHFRSHYEQEQKAHDLTRIKLEEIRNYTESVDVYDVLIRMEEFIEGGIKDRENLIRQIDRIRDHSVQNIRILEKEKAINMGLLNQKKVDRKIADRIGIFVDVQNMFYAARQQFNGRLDFQRLLSVVTRDRRIERAVAYIIETPDIDQSSFISLLSHCGYEVKSKALRTRVDGSAKGDWDMEMAMDMISFLPKLDVVILVSGDGDFVPLVLKIQNEYHLKCEVYGFEHNTAIDLKETADEFHPIGKELILESVPDKS